VFAQWEKIKEASRELEQLRGELVAWEASPLVDNRDQERVLADLGFVDEKRELSVLGRAATEVHEGHPLLMSLLAERGVCAGLSAAEVAMVLACFIRESAMPEDAAPSLNAVGTRAVADVLMAVQVLTDECMRCEDRHKVGTADDYWRLRLDWVLVVERWFAGSTLSEIAVELGIYEGVVQRGLLRLDNLLDEWRAVEEVRRDLAMLELLNGFRVAGDGVIVDSLYLRMK
jgi:superfamily II RNA helicase